MAFTTRMVSGYNRGGVTIHAPSGDGNISYDLTYTDDEGLQSTPRQGTEIRCKAVRSNSFGVTIHAPSGDGNSVYYEGGDE